MEIKRRIDFRRIAIILYSFLFVIYLIVGLNSAGAASEFEIEGELEIPAIGLETDVARLVLENHRLNTPDTIAGSFSWSDNKTLIIGHSTTVFSSLTDVSIGDNIVYDGKEYVVTDMVVMEKPNIKMNELLEEADEDTLVIMTCAGELLVDGDATHRLIVTAVAA